MSSAPEILHRLETPHPFQPAPGYFRLEGWMFVRGAPSQSHARLRLGDRIFLPESIIERSDVAQAFPDEPSALRSGFRFLCFVQFGLYVGALEASANGQAWHHVRTFAIPVSSHPLLGAVEKPAPHTPINRPLRIEGWCFHPEFNVSEVALRFGNLEVPCDYRLERPDVAKLFPQYPIARDSGFITSENLPRGSGKLRVRVSTSCGRNYFLDSALHADIARGNDPKSSPLSTVRTPLTVPAAAHSRPRSPRAPNSLPPPGERNILFALYGDFTCNSALHVAALANELIARGYDCVVAGPSHKETITALPRARFMALEFAEWEDLPDYFVDHRGPALVHAWTPRENVRHFTECVCAAYGIPYLVHLEDHEPTILESRLGRSTAELLALPPLELDALVPEHLSHPRRAPEFLARAAGVTTIVEKLHELVPRGVPSLTFWPAADSRIYFPRVRDESLRASLGIASSDTVLLYHGNVHAANADEVGSLYQAVALLNRRGRRTFLIRAGRDDAGLMEVHNTATAGQVLHLGYVAPRFLPEIMRLADYFVQPGLPGAFNDYRFPSKLPEFFSIGRPVILPRTNLGEAVRHGEDAYVLDRADAGNIADAILALHTDPALTATLSQGALRFAAENFSWPSNATRLLEFYRLNAGVGSKASV